MSMSRKDFVVLADVFGRALARADMTGLDAYRAGLINGIESVLTDFVTLAPGLNKLFDEQRFRARVYATRVHEGEGYDARRNRRGCGDDATLS